MSRLAEPPFWLVWSETGFPPRFKHDSPDAAEAEARRLACGNPGKSFVVLAPLARFTSEVVKVERFDHDAYVPF